MSNLTKDEARARAREDCTKHYIEHERKLNRYVSEESARRYVNERADVQDKKRDRGEKS